MELRVLVVDDEKNIRTTLADILIDAGCQVVIAESGERAVKLCAKQPFDVVLLDVRMPGIDGVETCRRICAKWRTMRVILMSAYGIDQLHGEAREAGALGFLRKPLDLDRLIELIGAV